jgi:hypothetical protein
MKISSLFPLAGLILLPNLVDSAFANEVAGKTMVARGKVQAQQETADNSRKLKRRSPIYSNEIVTTGPDSKAQLRMTDGGMIALKQNSQLQISDYEFSSDNGRGSVVMELVKGGLRSVTGAIKAESGDYKLKTPVGSIGIRGTHYEVELVGDTIWVAVWDGAVDLDITSGESAGSTLSLGDGEGYSYASIDATGKVTTYVEPPETFESGMTSEPDDIEETEEAEEAPETEEQGSTSSASEQQPETATESEGNENSNEENSQENTDDTDSNDANSDQSETEASQVATSSVAVTITPDDTPETAATQAAAEEDSSLELNQLQSSTTEIENPAFLPDDEINDNIDAFDQNLISDTELLELIDNKTGSVSYSKLDAPTPISSAGTVTNFQMNMTIDFDKGTIPGGTMSMEDEGGEWFATFGGVISSTSIDLDVTFASHGDNLAEGEVDAVFDNGIDSILGSFILNEIKNPNIKVEGSFKVGN